MLSKNIAVRFVVLCPLLAGTCTTTSQPPFNPNEAVAAGKGIVYVYRPRRFIGSAIKINVYDATAAIRARPELMYRSTDARPGDNYEVDWDEALRSSDLVAVLKDNEYQAVSCEPGDRVFFAQGKGQYGESPDVIRVRVEVGKQYFIQTHIQAGGRPENVLMTNEMGLAEIASTTRSDPPPAGRK